MSFNVLINPNRRYGNGSKWINIIKTRDERNILYVQYLKGLVNSHSTHVVAGSGNL